MDDKMQRKRFLQKRKDKAMHLKKRVMKEESEQEGRTA